MAGLCALAAELAVEDYADDVSASLSLRELPALLDLVSFFV